jgi:hypothetical protein
MRRNLTQLPNWAIDIDEVSAGVYRVVAKHSLGPTIDQIGTDPEELLKQVTKSAEAMEKDIERKLRP